jgi:hypothetical protein
MAVAEAVSGNASFFPAFAGAPDVGADTELDIAAGDAGEFGEP